MKAFKQSFGKACMNSYQTDGNGIMEYKILEIQISGVKAASSLAILCENRFVKQISTCIYQILKSFSISSLHETQVHCEIYLYYQCVHNQVAIIYMQYMFSLIRIAILSVQTTSHNIGDEMLCQVAKAIKPLFNIVIISDSVITNYYSSLATAIAACLF